MVFPLSLSRVVKPRAGWYRGDFHTHTHFSDGSLSPAELAAVARSEGLDFLAITDHNTIAAYPGFGNVSDLAIIPGLEVTLNEGHFNVFGIEQWFDWLADLPRDQSYLTSASGELQSMTAWMRQLAGQGLLNSINHPRLAPWDWLDRTTDLRYVHCLEIWNDPSWPANRQANPLAIAMWTDWLKAGYRITAIGGSDYHHPQPKTGENKPPERLGLPRTYVYADELSGRAILAGLRQRRAYVSMGPEVTFQATLDGKIYDIGADLGEQRGEIVFNGTIFGAPSTARAQILKNGQVIAEMPLEAEPTTLHYVAQASLTQSDWYRLDVWNRDGLAVVVTNPIFVGPQQEPARFTYGAFIPPSDNSD